jgi:hypothetical protein
MVNYKSVHNCWDAINENIEQERAEGFISRVPFVPSRVNALGAVSKSDGKWRRITDLSKPTGNALNEYAKKPTKFSFASVDDAVKFVFKHNGKVIVASKYDIKAAFRHVPVRPEFWHLLGFYWNGHYYVDLRMCFGLSLAPYIFWRISNFISRTAATHYGVEENVPYLDDFFLLSAGDDVASATTAANIAHENFRRCLTDLGWPIVENKVTKPCQDLSFLGIRVNLVEQELSLPPEKLQAILTELQLFSTRTSAVKRDVERLVGRLNFAASVVKGGRTFLHRMIDTVNSVQDHNAVVHLTDDFRADVAWWLRFASQWNGRAMMIDPAPIGGPRFVTDASDAAVCAVFDSEFIVRYACPVTNVWHINDRECLAVYLAALKWAESWRDKHVVVESDNQTTVYAINKGSSRSPIIMAMLRSMFWLSANHNFHITARHIPGTQNTLADAGSRKQFDKMFEIAPDI